MRLWEGVARNTHSSWHLASDFIIACSHHQSCRGEGRLTCALEQVSGLMGGNAVKLCVGVSICTCRQVRIGLMPHMRGSNKCFRRLHHVTKQQSLHTACLTPGTAKN